MDPEGLPDRLAREAGADIRAFSRASHVSAPLYGQTVRAGSLKRDICAIGSTTPLLTPNSIDWTRHSGKKAADRACVGLAFLFGLTLRGVFVVLREKKSRVFEAQRRKSRCVPGHLTSHDK
ncbi:MAG TPA: hypothetical protein P5026_12600 [Kiritimatiellia bacterium]|nr:hypothetical protein [Kiritimatiellia bacterium]HRU69466.1 hypothetical protein [Kiritimatiellia bacterium]